MSASRIRGKLRASSPEDQRKSFCSNTLEDV
ncbi:type III-B CRISPR module RAMP protein Cmr4, partial [Cuspidothrix issatschenkoi CHARLIE-1]